MLMTFFSVLLQVAAAVPQPSPPVWEAAAPALAAKAPGAPGYGLQATTSKGKVLITNLSFDPKTHKPVIRLYRIDGPAGWGPYRSGLERCLTFSPANPQAGGNALHSSWFENHFAVGKPPKGSPADKVGLDGSGGFLRIDGADGSHFGWDVNALIFHITQSPIVAIDTVKLPVFFSPSRKIYRITNQRIEAPVDPGDANLVGFLAHDEVKKGLADPQPWKDLLILRSQKDAFAPLPMDLAGRKIWVVRGQGIPSHETPPKVPWVLEFWKEDPGTGVFGRGILDLWPEPEEGMQVGRALRVEDRWYRLEAYAQDPATARLTSFKLRPWEAPVPSLLGGADLASELGSQRTPAIQETLEQLANEALVEWKTRALPGQLRNQDERALEDLVVRVEKGLLSLDRHIRGIRQRLDAQARAQAAQQALTNKPGQEPLPAPAATASTCDSEGLADLLDQRKAILMAILGSTKQSLANLRR